MEYYHTLLTIGSQAYRFISQNRDSLFPRSCKNNSGETSHRAHKLESLSPETITKNVQRLGQDRTGEECYSKENLTPFCMLIIKEDKKRCDQNFHFPYGCHK